MRLDGKVCIITGAGSGQGRAAALRFATEGARVVIAEIDARLPAPRWPMRSARPGARRLPSRPT